MELKEAIEILKAKKDQYQREVTFVPEQNGKKYIAEMDWFDTLLEGVEELQKENEKLKEIDLTTVHIKGVCDEKERWRNKIKEKIEELKKVEKNCRKNGLEKNSHFCKIQMSILQELLKGE